MNMSWDAYFLKLAQTVAENSKCFSRHVGAVIVKNNRVIATGYNGPPCGSPDCTRHNPIVQEEMAHYVIGPGKAIVEQRWDAGIRCPRQLLGYKSGEGLHLCPATHGEVNSILSAARNGTCVEGATMYLTCEIPCQKCMGQIINAGIAEIVITSWKNYDKMARYILEKSNIIVRINHHAGEEK